MERRSSGHRSRDDSHGPSNRAARREHQCVPQMKTTNLLVIQRVLEEAGVIFLDPDENQDGGVGPPTDQLIAVATKMSY